MQQLDECGPCHVLASYTLAFALQPRKKHGKTSVRVAASNPPRFLIVGSEPSVICLGAELMFGQRVATSV